MALEGPLGKLPHPLVAAIVTCAAFALSLFMTYDITSLSYFTPMEKASNFRFCDFYERVSAKRAVSEEDDRVVIVSVDGCTRSEIGRAIADVNFCLPRAVGLDVMFGPPRPGADDSLLIKALCTTPGIVLPVLMNDSTYRPKRRSYYDRFTGSGARYAAINVEGSETTRTTVRSFRTRIGAVPGIAAALAGTDGGADSILSIPYSLHRFAVIPADSVLDCMDRIEGRIVLIGKVEDRGDTHITPLDNFAPGVLIHAHCIATLLNGDAPRRLSLGWQLLIAFGLCYAVVLLNLRYDGFRANLGVRLLQFALLILMIFTGTKIYVAYGIDINCERAVIMVTLGLVACDIVCGVQERNRFYTAVEKYYRKLFKKKKINNETKSDSDSHGSDAVGHDS